MTLPVDISEAMVSLVEASLTRFMELRQNSMQTAAPMYFEDAERLRDLLRALRSALTAAQDEASSYRAEWELALKQRDQAQQSLTAREIDLSERTSQRDAWRERAFKAETTLTVRDQRITELETENRHLRAEVYE